MIKLTQWYLTEHLLKDTKEKCYVAHGVVSGHPKLADGDFINTSIIEEIRLDSSNNCLIMLTHSKNEYMLLLADIDFDGFEKTRDYLEEFNVPTLSLRKCLKLHHEAEEDILSKVENVLQNNELYLQFYGVFAQKAFFKNDAGEIREIRVTPHIGMFQDSYLITDFERGEVDFRYFDSLNGIEPYHWSDGLKALRIDNAGQENITFLSGDNLVCKSGEITLIESSQFGGEGLFSPDVVNGKSLFFSKEGFNDEDCDN